MARRRRYIASFFLCKIQGRRRSKEEEDIARKGSARDSDVREVASPAMADAAAGSVLQAPFRASYRVPSWSASTVHAGGVTFSLEPVTACVVDRDQEEVEEERRQVLDACFLCGRHLGGGGVEVFMYRGDTPFCSEECREEQMVLDEAREREKAYYRRRQHQRRHGAASAKQAPAARRRGGLCMRTGS